MSCELVIFDCDGVLVDSEPISNRVFTAALHELGFDWSYRDVCRRFIGRSMAHCLAEIECELGRPLPPQFLAELQRRTFEAFQEERLQPVAGIPELLDRLAVPFCVASSGEPVKMRTTLGLTGLLPRFAGRMFSATQVRRGKPAPDLFLLAAESCGARPERCVVIEDSTPGVQAGVAAGMTVLGYQAGDGGSDLAAHGATVFRAMGEVPALLAQAGEQR